MLRYSIHYPKIIYSRMTIITTIQIMLRLYIEVDSFIRKYHNLKHTRGMCGISFVNLNNYNFHFSKCIFMG